MGQKMSRNDRGTPTRRIADAPDPPPPRGSVLIPSTTQADLHSDLLVKEAPVGTPPSEVEIQGEKEGKRDKEEDEDPFSSSISVRQRDGIGVTVTTGCTYVVETLNGGTQLSLLHRLFSDLPIQKPGGTGAVVGQRDWGLFMVEHSSLS